MLSWIIEIYLCQCYLFFNIIKAVAEPNSA